MIVDEAQDLSAAMVRMLHSLVGDAPDGLTLIGDGQQSIYPGGYTLAEAGVSLAGRGVVLDVNYRNTAQILAFASRMVDGDEFADIEGEIEKGNRPVLVPRSGPQPVIERCASRARAGPGDGGARPGRRPRRRAPAWAASACCAPRTAQPCCRPTRCGPRGSAS